jgi:hypothetical protein
VKISGPSTHIRADFYPMTNVITHEVMTLGTSTPRLRVDWQRQPNRYLTIDDVPAYQIGYSCGTCGLVPEHLDPVTLARHTDAPGTPTAVALGLLDVEGPWFRRERHAGLFHFLRTGPHGCGTAHRLPGPFEIGITG